jgi:hypothetical protein
MARALFAVGHMLPSFALLLVAAGVGLLVEEEPPSIAYWLPCIGIGMYLLGTRVFLAATTHRGRVWRLVLLVAIFNLGRLLETLEPHAYVWLLTVLAIVCAALSMRKVDREDVQRYFGSRPPRRSGTSSRQGR